LKGILNYVDYKHNLRRLVINTFRKPFGGGPSSSSRGNHDFKKRGDKDGPRLNREIRCPQVRVIDEKGEILGIMSSDEAVRLAEGRGLDLLEVAANANPPTCKIIDYGKYKYEQKKKQAQARKNQVIILTKEIQLRPRTDVHDVDVKAKHARRFLLDGDKVKINVRFSGREMAHQEVGLGTLLKLIEMLKDLALVETAPKMEGRQMFALLAPDPAKVKEYLKLHPKGNAHVATREEAEKSLEENEKISSSDEE
jgi:translation initiation factor IF-3